MVSSVIFCNFLAPEPPKWDLDQPESLIRLFLWAVIWAWSQTFQRNFPVNKMTIRCVPRRSVQKKGLCGQFYISKGLIPLLTSWFVWSLIRPHFQSDHNMPAHCQHGNPSACAVRGDIYDVYVPLLLPPMLCIGCKAIATGDHWARQFVDALWPKLLSKRK